MNKAEAAQVQAANRVSKEEIEHVMKLIEQNKEKHARILRLLGALHQEGVKKQNIAAIRQYLERQR